MTTTTADRRVAFGAKSFSARRVLEFGGFIAGAILIAFGVVAIVMGVNGRWTVQDSLTAEKIVGGDDMSPALITKAVD